jgi:2,5-dihydroxypyridine 5,6-dioxygenase
MLSENVNHPGWSSLFAEVLSLAAPKRGEVVAIFSETRSRGNLVRAVEQAVHQLGLSHFHLRVPSPLTGGPPLRSTGTSLAIAGVAPVIDALAGADLIVDLSVEGLLHSAERPKLLERGARIFMIGDEDPEVFERLRPRDGLHELCVHGASLITAASQMRVTSAAGSDLTVDLEGVAGRGSAGVARDKGSFGYWPAGLCLASPKPASVNGRLVFMPGDANLTFKRYFDSRVELVIEHDYVRSIEGSSLDAELLRSYFAAFDTNDAYATSHVGWGMNPACRWDSMVMYDKRDINGIELRAFAGNFLFSTGANEAADRFTSCHFDWPMRNCTVQLDDDEPVVSEGILRADLRMNR